ncbi:MAG: amidophosphoribosyltransferase [Oscillospiraceae bacterium]
MGGFFGATSRRECVEDVFFGVDYHSHLGTRRAGMAALDDVKGFQREIHKIENSPFRTKFEKTTSEMTGRACIGCISDNYPQPILIRSKLGVYAISSIGVINNAAELAAEYLGAFGGYLESMSGGKINEVELLAALISQKDNFTDGIRFAREKIDGTASVLILKEDGRLIAARDKFGRIPVSIGRDEDGFAVSFEPFAYRKLGYTDVRELGPAEIVEISPEGVTVLAPPEKEKRICAFLWTYYGYPSSDYEGVSVEVARNRNGKIMAQEDKKRGTAPEVDYVCGVPDSGTPHAIGYANAGVAPFARPFIKYTPTWPRSFMPLRQEQRNEVAKMKLIPVPDLINGKKLLFVDDSIVRGTQMRETVDFLYENGAQEVHMRSACPPIMHGCKFLNFSRGTSDMELLARQTIRELEGDEGDAHLNEYSDRDTERGRTMRDAIRGKLHMATLEYQTLEGVLESIGLPPCDVCTYCWDGRE